MHSGHVDSMYIVTSLLLEEHNLFGKQLVSSGDFCDSSKHIDGGKFCLKYTNLVGTLLIHDSIKTGFHDITHCVV